MDVLHSIALHSIGVGWFLSGIAMRFTLGTLMK